MLKKKKEEIKFPDTKYCDRCGNDFMKGKYMWHFPYKKMYISVCHICYQGFLYGFFMDVSRELKEIRKDE